MEFSRLAARPIPMTDQPPDLCPGGACSCNPNRRIRYIVAPVPGIPQGEISCRTEGETLRADVRYHPIPRLASIVVRSPSIATPRYLTDADRQAMALARYGATAAALRIAP